MNIELNEKCWYKDFCSLVETQGCEHCNKYKEMNYLMEHSGLPKAKQKVIRLIPTTDPDEIAFDKLNTIKNDIYNFVQDGKNLYITGTHTGNGKTSWSIKLLHKYFEEVWKGNCYRVRGLFVHVPTLLLELKDFNHVMSSSYRKLLRECDLVVWDDIASTELSNFDCTQLLALIDYRMLAEKSNIYTGNIVSKNDMSALLGERLASRIYKASQVIELTGKDNRDGSITDTE